jgi:transposase
VRYDQKPFADLFERVYERTNIKMKGYVAVQRKMLIYIYTLWKNNQPYQPQENNISGNDESKSLFLLVSEGNIMIRKRRNSPGKNQDYTRRTSVQRVT